MDYRVGNVARLATTGILGRLLLPQNRVFHLEIIPQYRVEDIATWAHTSSRKLARCSSTSSNVRSIIDVQSFLAVLFYFCTLLHDACFSRQIWYEFDGDLIVSIMCSLPSANEFRPLIACVKHQLDALVLADH